MTSTGRRAAPLGSNAERTRRRNLGLVLQAVHGRPLTRGNLARVLVLNRSTVKVLVDELQDLGLVTSGPARSDGTHGRPSPIIRPTDDLVAVGAAVDTRSLTVGLVQLGGRVLRQERIEFGDPPSLPALVALTHDLAHELLTSTTVQRVLGYGLAVPGVVEQRLGTVRAPHMGWHNGDLLTTARSLLGGNVAISNDAQAAARAEWTFGAGHGAELLVYVHGGDTGIGGATMLHGTPLRGAHGLAGEFGALGLSFDTMWSSTATISTSISRDRLIAHVGLGGGTDAELAGALSVGPSHELLRELSRQRTTLISLLAAIVLSTDPDRIVIGGFLRTLVNTLPNHGASLVADAIGPLAGVAPDIRLARSGTDDVLVGAAQPIFDSLFDDPKGADSSVLALSATR